MELAPIKRVVVHDAIINLIKSYIISNSLTPGDRLPSERDLAKTLDVSRNSVREAFKSMQSQGYIRISHGAGTYVSDVSGFTIEKCEFDAGFLEQILQIREMVEIYSATLLASSKKSVNLSELENIILREREKDKMNDTSDLPNIDFETEIVRLIGNSLLYGFYFNIATIWKDFWKKNGCTVLNATSRHEDHTNILKAIQNGKADKAAKLVKAHLKGVQLILK
ncbi:MAG: GntR family transcriptional regulator [Synergistaceae bacterium]|nr:GntR family transcriptional regulator [Synergistaceae bacterium]